MFQQQMVWLLALLTSAAASTQISNQCGTNERDRFAQCQAEAMFEWDVRDTDMHTETRRFCCFVWSTLNCEVDAIERCDPASTARLIQETEQAYGALCEYHYRNSPSCVLRWWSLALIILGIVAVVALVVFVVHRNRSTKFSREYVTNTEYAYR